MSNEHNSGQHQWGPPERHKPAEGTPAWQQSAPRAPQDWESGHQDDWGQTTVQPQASQGSAQEPQRQPSQQSASEWKQNDWGQPANDWGQQGQQWGQPAQQQPAQDWTHDPRARAHHEWSQGPQHWQSGNQGWNQSGAQAQQNQWEQQNQWGAPSGSPLPVPAGPAEPRNPSPFDFSFKKLSLPGSANLIFILGVVGLGVEWLTNVVSMLTMGDGLYAPPAMALVQTIFGGLGAALFKLLILRVLLEIAVKLTRRSEPTGDVDEDGPGTD